MSEPPGKDFKVAIVGGGMCGLLCAIGLVRAGIQVDVFEAAPRFDEVGAGVGLGPNALRALNSLGVLEAIISHSEERKPTLRPFRFLSGSGQHESIYNYPVSPQDLGLGIYRPAFLDALVPLLDSRLTHFDKRCTSLSTTASGSHILHFADGTTHEADLIVGADGIKSVVRNAVVRDAGASHLAFSNSVAYRGLVPTEALELAGVKTDLKRQPICWVGLDKHIITFPIQSNRVINIVAFSTNHHGQLEVPSPRVEAVAEQELLDEYKGWGDDAMTILKHMKNPSKWYIHSLNPPLKSYVHQKIALVGDAAHAMTPHLGAGVGQGFEDVYVLCTLLGHPQTKARNLVDALKTYETIRLPRANMVLERSARMGDIFETFGANGYTAQDMRSHLAGMWEPVWHHDLEKEVEVFVKQKALL